MSYFTILLLINRETKKKINRDIENLKNIINQLGQINNYRTRHPYTFFETLWKFTVINHILDNKIILNDFKGLNHTVLVF